MWLTHQLSQQLQSHNSYFGNRTSYLWCCAKALRIATCGWTWCTKCVCSLLWLLCPWRIHWISPLCKLRHRTLWWWSRGGAYLVPHWLVQCTRARSSNRSSAYDHFSRSSAGTCIADRGPSLLSSAAWCQCSDRRKLSEKHSQATVWIGAGPVRFLWLFGGRPCPRFGLSSRVLCKHLRSLSKFLSQNLWFLFGCRHLSSAACPNVRESCSHRKRSWDPSRQNPKYLCMSLSRRFLCCWLCPWDYWQRRLPLASSYDLQGLLKAHYKNSLCLYSRWRWMTKGCQWYLRSLEPSTTAGVLRSCNGLSHLLSCHLQGSASSIVPFPWNWRLHLWYPPNSNSNLGSN